MALNLANYPFGQTITGQVPPGDTSGQILLITEANVDSTFWTNVANGGGAIRICEDEEGLNQLPVDLRLCNAVTQKLLLWTRKPNYLTTDRKVVIFSANNADTQPAADAPFGSEEVWQDFRAVYHLDEAANNTAGGYKDATGNGYDGTGVSMSESLRTLPSGLIGSSFNGTNDYILLPNSIFPTTTQSEFTAIAWVQPDTLATDGRVFNLSNTVNNDDVLTLWLDADGAGDGWASITKVNGVNFNTSFDENNAAVGRWDYVATQVSSTLITTNVNGSPINSTAITETNGPRTIDIAEIARFGVGSPSYLNGGIAELWFSLNTISDDILAVNYANQSSPSTFLTQSAPFDPSATGGSEQPITCIPAKAAVVAAVLNVDQNLNIFAISAKQATLAQQLSVADSQVIACIPALALCKAALLAVDLQNQLVTLAATQLSQAGVLSFEQHLVLYAVSAKQSARAAQLYVEQNEGQIISVVSALAATKAGEVTVSLHNNLTVQSAQQLVSAGQLNVTASMVLTAQAAKQLTVAKIVTLLQGDSKISADNLTLTRITPVFTLNKTTPVFTLEKK